MCEEFKSALKKYLCDAEIYTGDDSRVWDIIELPVYGRCLVANRDIQVNELIFYDKHLIAGPRSNNYDKVYILLLLLLSFVLIQIIRNQNFGSFFSLLFPLHTLTRSPCAYIYSK